MKNDDYDFKYAEMTDVEIPNMYVQTLEGV